MMENNNRPLFLLEEELTYKLRGIFIEISKKHGFSYKENIYQELLIEAFQNDHLGLRSKPKIPVYSFETGKFIGNYYPDFVVEDKIIIEIKSQSQIFNNHINQLIRYLSTTKYEIGLIVNFGTPKVEIIRRIFTNDRKPFLARMTHGSITDDPPDDPRMTHGSITDDPRMTHG